MYPLRQKSKSRVSLTIGEHPIASQFVGQASRLSLDVAQAFWSALGEIFACIGMHP
jgi:hypothetical protein